MKTPSEALERARASITSLTGVVDLGAWYFDEDRSVRKWTIDVRLRHGSPATPRVPKETQWHVVVDDEYPWGEVRFFPAAAQSIEGTHPHQHFNGRHLRGGARFGEICLSRPSRGIGRVGDDEPYDDDARLAAQVSRALEWLRDAAAGMLVIDGEPFELPDFPGAKGSPETCAFIETSSSLDAWTDGPRLGLAIIRSYGAMHVVESFHTRLERPFREVDWGAFVGMSTPRDHAVWARLDRVAVHEPWHPPQTLGELAAVFAAEGRELVDEIADLASRHEQQLRDGRRHLLLVGFPIPRTHNSLPERMHWQAVRLPALCDRRAKGMRPTRPAFLQRDRELILRPGIELEWMNSENWADDNLTARGTMPSEITRQRVLIIGCGALGSAVAEIFVRGGARDVVLLDADLFHAGNAVRHTLTLDCVGSPKAEAVARRLSLVSPHARVSSVRGAFPLVWNEQTKRPLTGTQLVIDTTGSDAVITSLDRATWSDPEPRIVSISIGYAARRLFVYAGAIRHFSAAAFRAALEPWILKERGEMAGSLPREGIGCWHPVFPARVDDVWLLAAVAAKSIAAAWATSGPSLRVFEQSPVDATFVGVREVSSDPPC